MSSNFRSILSSKIWLLIFCLCTSCASANSSNNVEAITNTYDVPSWSGQWEFSGFGIGPVSGDHYYLLSYSTDSECGIIRENKNGTRVWAKRYTADACGVLTIDSTETNLYFANKENPSYLGLAKIRCSDGILQIYFTSTSFYINGNRFKLRISDSGNTIFFSGSVLGGNRKYFCTWDTTTNFECSSTTTPNDYIATYSNSDDWMFYMRDSSQYFGVYMLNLITKYQIWAKTLRCSSNCPNHINEFSDYDGLNLYTALTLSASPAYSIFIIYERTTGNVQNNLEVANNGQDVQIGSLYVDSNSVAWLNFYQSGSDYSELIKYDLATDTSITYMQTGAKYFYQYVDASNSNYWHGVVFASKTTGALIDNMNMTSLVTLNTTTPSFISSSITIEVRIVSTQLNQYTEALSTGTSNPESDLIYTVSESCEGCIEDEPTEDESTVDGPTEEGSADGPFEDKTAKVVSIICIIITCVSIALTTTQNINASSESSSSNSNGSRQSIWVLINLYQEILLIPLLGTYLGNDFHFYITEFQLTLFDFQFLKFIKVPVLESDSSLIDKIDFEQSDELFADNEYASGSAFYNCFQIIKSMLIFLIFNIAFIVIRCIINKMKPKKECWYKIVDWFAGFFHFSVYLRLMFESCVYIFISCMLELSQFDNEKNHRVSNILALLVSFVTLSFILIPIHYFKYRKQGAIETWYLAEVYDGFKDTAWSKLYMFIFILRRFIMALVIVFMRDVNVWIRCVSYTFIQFVVLGYTIIVRPFDQVKENLIEILNEVTYTVLCIVITIFNDESKWFDDLDIILIYSLMVVGILITIIINVDMICGCIQKYRQKKAKNRAETYRDDGAESINNARLPSQEQVIVKESEPRTSDVYMKNLKRKFSRSLKQTKFSRVQNENDEKERFE